MKRIKVAVIGVGGISASHIAAYRMNPYVELFALCDINEEKLKAKGQLYGISRLYTDVEKMLNDLPEIDAVSVCVWNCNHAKCTIAALNAGKHVLCEKPIATSISEAEEMIEVAKRNNRILMVGFCCRFGTDTKVIQELQRDGMLGDIYYAKASYLRRNGNPGGWFANKSMSAGGPLIDLGVHILDLTRYLMGNPKPVSVFGATFNKLGNRPNVYKPTDAYLCTENNDVCDVEDLATAMIRYENGAVLFLESSYSLNLKEDVYSMELFGTNGGVRICPNFEVYSDKCGYSMNMQLANVKIDDSVDFPNEINHFVDCILNGTECIAPGSDGVDVLKILLAIYKSAECGHEVIL